MFAGSLLHYDGCPPLIRYTDDRLAGREGGFRLAKTLADAQHDVHAYITQFKEGYFTPMTLVVRLAEELGELAREVNHAYGEKSKKASEPEGDIALELGDMLFVMICLANRLGIDLEDAHRRVLEKFNTRDINRWTRVEESERP